MRGYVAILPIVLAAATACASDQIPGPPAGFNHATAMRECGPTDGPAVAIYLAADSGPLLQPPTPYILITVWQSLDRLGQQSWTVANEQGMAAAWFFSAPNNAQNATSGRVTVNIVDTTSTIQGSVDLTFPAVGRVSGGFRASWIPRTLMCG
jgi:hypothetical protein